MPHTHTHIAEARPGGVWIIQSVCVYCSFIGTGKTKNNECIIYYCCCSYIGTEKQKEKVY